MAVQLHARVGLEPSRLRALDELRQRREVEGRRRRRRVVGVAQEVERRAQVVQRVGGHRHDVLQGFVAPVQMGGDSGADVDRDESVRDRVVQISRDADALVGDAAAVLLLAFLAPGFPELAS